MDRGHRDSHDELCPVNTGIIAPENSHKRLCTTTTMSLRGHHLHLLTHSPMGGAGRGMRRGLGVLCSWGAESEMKGACANVTTCCAIMAHGSGSLTATRTEDSPATDVKAMRALVVLWVMHFEKQGHRSSSSSSSTSSLSAPQNNNVEDENVASDGEVSVDSDYT